MVSVERSSSVAHEHVLKNEWHADLAEDKKRPESSYSELVSFVVPIYNEEENIARNLDECVRTIGGMGFAFEIIAVNDGSKDDTFIEILKAASRHPEIVPVSYPTNTGKGSALKYGTRWAKGGFIIFLDADLEIHPNHAQSFIETMKETNADIVIGSKRHPDSHIDYPAKRRFLSGGYHILIRMLFDLEVTDTQPGFKLLRRSALDLVLPKVQAKRYAFDLDLLVTANQEGLRIVEMPIDLRFSRNFGGRIGFKTVRSIFKETLSIFYRSRIRQTSISTPVHEEKALTTIAYEGKT